MDEKCTIAFGLIDEISSLLKEGLTMIATEVLMDILALYRQQTL